MPDFICGEKNVIYLYYLSKFTQLCWSCLINMFLNVCWSSSLKKHVSSCINFRYAWWPSCGRSPEQKGAQLEKRNEYDVYTPRPSIYHQSPTRMDLLPQTFDTLTNFYGHLQALGVYTIIHIYMCIYIYISIWLLAEHFPQSASIFSGTQAHGRRYCSTSQSELSSSGCQRAWKSGNPWGYASEVSH
jgi:hypothetical protein